MRPLLCLFLFFCSSLFAKVYDGFLFFNEIETLKIRFAELNDVVDYFILVESKDTFQGDPKPLYFEENKELFAPYLDKIIHIIVEKSPGFTGWNREHYQRNCIIRGLDDAEPTDLIIISDCDEIPRACALLQIVAEEWYPEKFGVFRQAMCTYHLNRIAHYDLFGSVITTVQSLKEKNACIIRRLRHKSAIEMQPMGKQIENGGWHFHSQGGYEQLEKKLRSYNHPENLEIIDQLMEEYLSTPSVPIDDFFPEYVRENEDYLISIGYVSTE